VKKTEMNVPGKPVQLSVMFEIGLGACPCVEELVHHYGRLQFGIDSRSNVKKSSNLRIMTINFFVTLGPGVKAINSFFFVTVAAAK
jgi:hypothetical protein